MTPENAPAPAELVITGYAFEHFYIAGPGVILSLSPPPKIALAENLTPEPTLHIAFIPATEWKDEKPGVPFPTLILKTHNGPLPTEIMEACQEPDNFAPLKGLAVTGQLPTPNGPGVNLIFGEQYRLQIDLDGANVYPAVKA